jgi:hypothetical protein
MRAFRLNILYLSFDRLLIDFVDVEQLDHWPFGVNVDGMGLM